MKTAHIIVSLFLFLLLPCIAPGCAGGDETPGDSTDETPADQVQEDQRADQADPDIVQDGEVACGEGETVCSGSCVNIQTDHANCGSCAHACAPAEVCVGGDCALECPSGTQNCSGTCINLQNDPQHCGSCTNACSPSEVCSSGSCTLDCGSGYTNCSGSCVDLNTDFYNCGYCGHPCASNEQCSGATCVCVPDCYLAQCGPNGCGGNCGTCEAGMICSVERACEFHEILISISRSPVTSPSSPFHAGDSTTFTVDVAPWSWIVANVTAWTFKSITTDTVAGTSMADADFIAAMSDIIALGACNSSGHCVFGPDVWQADQFNCGGVNVVNLRSREEWTEINGFSSNHSTFYFVCSDP